MNAQWTKNNAQRNKQKNGDSIQDQTNEQKEKKTVHIQPVQQTRILYDERL